MSEMKKRPDINECAARRLDRSQLSRKELGDYLRKRGYEDGEIEKVVTDLTDLGYLDDAGYAREFFVYEFRRNRSRKKAIYDLRIKGVSEENIEAGYNEYLDEYGEPDEHSLAYQEAVKVLRSAELEPGSIPEDMRQKIEGRIARRLFTRGFSQSLIYEILSEIRNG